MSRATNYVVVIELSIFHHWQLDWQIPDETRKENHDCNNTMEPKSLWSRIQIFVFIRLVFCCHNCSDLLWEIFFANFANSRPSASNFKSFSQSLAQFFLTLGQNNFGNKIQFLSHQGLLWHHFVTSKTCLNSSATEYEEETCDLACETNFHTIVAAVVWCATIFRIQRMNPHFASKEIQIEKSGIALIPK